jgi:26S proteasome subunit RPN7
MDLRSACCKFNILYSKICIFSIRIGLFFTDHEIIKGNIDKAKQMLEEGGDWDRRNRLKVRILFQVIDPIFFSRVVEPYIVQISKSTGTEYSTDIALRLRLQKSYAAISSS